MKKNIFLTSVVAVCVACGARAETDVTFAGDYTLENGSTANLATPVAGATYSYEKSDGSQRTDVAYDTDPTLSDFTYTDKDGNTANLSSGTPSQSDFTGTSAVDNTVVFTTQDIVSGTTVDRANYSYVNGAGDTVVLGDAAQDMTQNIALDSTYASGLSVDVTNGTAASAIDGTMYTYTTDSGFTYHLSADGSSLVNSADETVTPDTGTPLETAFFAMQAAYTADAANITAAEAATAAQWTDEQANFAIADAAVTTDTATVSTLDGYYDTLVTATNLLTTAQSNQTTAGATQASNDANRAAAAALYNSSIETTISDAQAVTLQDAKDYADGLASNYDAAGTSDAEATRAQGEEAAIRSEFAAADTTLQNNIDSEATRAQGEEAAIRSEFAAADATLQANIDGEVTRATNAENTLQANIDTEASTRATADATLQANIDNEVARATAQEAAIRNEIAAADARVLASANAYTDKKVDVLEKNISGGVAAATALSAVEVSNVKRGEVSVGGGYGYYNDQSAIALGAAMGLSDSWSINAGAGIASGDKTQVSFRAGTNYKFKLF